jgi:heptosyltransferase-2
MDFAVIRLSSFGDIILTEPVTRAIKAGFPGSRVFFITRADLARVPALFEAVDEVVPYRREGPNDEILKLGGAVSFEGVLDLQNNLRSRRVCSKLKKRRLVRYSRPLLKRFLLVRMPRLYKGDLRHTVDLYGDALARFGAALDDRVPRIRLGESELDMARRRLGREAAGKPLVAVCPGGSSEFKRWPETSFARLIQSMAALGRDVVVLGSEQDRRFVEVAAARAGTPAPAVVVSRDAGDLAALLSMAAVTVTNDSGLMHLAAAAGSRVVAIFGPTSPSLGFAPLGAGHRIVGLDLGCSPCSYHGNRPCRLSRRVCMEDLAPQEVLSAVEGALAEAAADG